MRILQEQPFRTLEDFLARVDPRPVEAANLAQAGALEGFGSIPAVLERLKSGWRIGQMPLFALEPAGAQAFQEDWSIEQKAAGQQAVLGVSVDIHPLELTTAKTEGSLSTLDAAERVGQKIRIAGMRQSWRRSRTLRGEAIYYMSFEDLEGTLNVVIHEEVYRKIRGGMKGVGPYMIEGVVELDLATGEPLIRAERIERL
jgi:DNA polymerase III subunit alpha